MFESGKKYEISSLSNEKVKFINSLYQRKYRKELNLFVAEGVRICKEALENNWTIKYLLFCLLKLRYIRDLHQALKLDRF